MRDMKRRKRVLRFLQCTCAIPKTFARINSLNIDTIDEQEMWRARAKVRERLNVCDLYMINAVRINDVRYNKSLHR